MITIDARQDRVWVSEGPAPEVHIHHHREVAAEVCPPGMICRIASEPLNQGYSGGWVLLLCLLAAGIAFALGAVVGERSERKAEDTRRAARCVDKPFREASE